MHLSISSSYLAFYSITCSLIYPLNISRLISYFICLFYLSSSISLSISDILSFKLMFSSFTSSSRSCRDWLCLFKESFCCWKPETCWAEKEDCLSKLTSLLSFSFWVCRENSCSLHLNSSSLVWRRFSRSSRIRVTSVVDA